MIHIGIDVDGPLARLGVEWLRRINALAGTNYTTKDLTQWSMGHLWPGHEHEIMAILQDIDLYDYVDPEEGARDGVRLLAMIGSVSFVTDCPGDQAGRKIKWLERHGFLDHAARVFAIRNGARSGSLGKGLVRVDFLIDDNPDNLLEVEGFCGRGILWSNNNTPFNHDAAASGRWPVISSWSDEELRPIVNMILEKSRGA